MELRKLNAFDLGKSWEDLPESPKYLGTTYVEPPDPPKTSEGHLPDPPGEMEKVPEVNGTAPASPFSMNGEQKKTLALLIGIGVISGIGIHLYRKRKRKVKEDARGSTHEEDE